MAILFEVIFMHILQEMHVVCTLKIEFSHSLRLTVGKQHHSICIIHVTVKKQAECELQTVRKEGRTAFLGQNHGNRVFISYCEFFDSVLSLWFVLCSLLEIDFRVYINSNCLDLLAHLSMI